MATVEQRWRRRRPTRLRTLRISGENCRLGCSPFFSVAGAHLRSHSCIGVLRPLAMGDAIAAALLRCLLLASKSKILNCCCCCCCASARDQNFEAAAKKFDFRRRAWRRCSRQQLRARALVSCSFLSWTTTMSVAGVGVVERRQPPLRIARECARRRPFRCEEYARARARRTVERRRRRGFRLYASAIWRVAALLRAQRRASARRRLLF